MDKLVQDFIKSIRQVSYHNAGEGEMYWRERDAARKAENELKSLKAEMVKTYGKEFTAKIISETPHLCFSELELEGL